MHKKHFLICYDITHPKRLQRLHRLVSNQCFQLQYSVYYATLYPKQMDELIQKIEKIINRHHDDVRIYETLPLEQSFVIGKRCPEVMVFGETGQRMQW